MPVMKYGTSHKPKNISSFCINGKWISFLGEDVYISYQDILNLAGYVGVTQGITVMCERLPYGKSLILHSGDEVLLWNGMLVTAIRIP